MQNEIVERLLKYAPKSNSNIALELIAHQACETFAERLAENAVVVRGIDSSDPDELWTISGITDATHTALRLDVQPIKKVDPLVEKLRIEAKDLREYDLDKVADLLLEAADRIEGKA